MSVELEEALPLTAAAAEGAAGKATKAGGAGPATPPAPPKRKSGRKKNQPGKYSQLVVDTIRRLAERGGSSLARVYAEARQVPWFDQQHGRTYLKYSIKALVQNDTLLQVKGTGANGSFKLNRKKLEAAGATPGAGPATRRATPGAAGPRRAERRQQRRQRQQQQQQQQQPPAARAPPKRDKGAAARKDKGDKARKAAAGKKVKKAAKPSVPKVPKGRK
ncbi:LOW QUALITY PROTEIN: histone H1.10 [Lemur catta]|uniref:LOW QUALITY PROTEIN: histone H1.10 n=1 Tax=Lemur catta TaxID=9447 RepID=UPI001E26AB62|nr:LOW QUALITY PROTEIN: histone H1.10 [Lemur catta]